MAVFLRRRVCLLTIGIWWATPLIGNIAISVIFLALGAASLAVGIALKQRES